MTIERRTLRIPEVAKRLGIGETKCYQLARAGVLPSVRLGHRVLVPVSAFERWLEALAERSLQQALSQVEEAER